jgi:hypothetical protein
MPFIRSIAFVAFAIVLSPAAMQAATPVQKDVVAQPLHAPTTRAEAREAEDAAVAAAVIGAISGQFGERKVQVKLDDVHSTPNSLLEADVVGEGRLLIGDDDEWLPFRFAGLYDIASATASAPRLLIGGDAPGSQLSRDSAIAVQLRVEVQSRLDAEFREQAVRFDLDRADTLDAGKRYSRIEASGIAQFGENGRDGRTPADIHALYDRRERAWVRVSYELGSTANRGAIAAGG